MRRILPVFVIAILMAAGGFMFFIKVSYLFAATCFIALMTWVLERERSTLWTPGARVILVYAIYTVAQMLWIGATTTESLKDLMTDVRQILYPIAVYFCIRLATRNPEDLGRLKRWLDWFAVALFAHFYLLYFFPRFREMFQVDDSYTDNDMMAAGLVRFLHPGEQLILVFAIVYSCQTLAKFTYRAAILGAVGTMAEMLSLTRSAWISLVFSGFLFWLLVLDQKRRFVAAAQIILLVLISLVLVQTRSEGQFMISRLSSIYGMYEGGVESSYSTATRYQETIAAYEAWKETPIIGNGVGVPYRAVRFELNGGAMDAASQADMLEDRRFRTFGAKVHNGVMELLLHQGVIGLALLCFAIFEIVRRYFYFSKPGDRAWSPDEKAYWYALWSFLWMAVIGGSGFAELPFGISLFAMLGLLDSMAATRLTVATHAPSQLRPVFPGGTPRPAWQRA